MFKINKIKILRKKLKNKKWVQNKINTLLEATNGLQTFYQFECSEFFRGAMLAQRNLTWYYKRERKLRRQILFLESLKFQKNYEKKS